jgi:pimeloyl-ACP methyl ester carboxylesterase
MTRTGVSVARADFFLGQNSLAICSALAAVVGLLVSTVALAQPPATKPPATAPAAAPKEEKKEPPKPPEPERVLLDTKDGWKIHAMYYAPMEKIRKGKETVPVIMLHGWDGQGAEYSYLATGLQTYGHACLVPDLRGHGRSTSRKKLDGSLETVKVEDLKTQDMENMVLDVEACKKYLIARNNEGLVNIDMLTVVAAQEGCIVGINWAALDWSWPVTPVLKQGQDVKALILLSPMQTYKRLTASKALQTPALARHLSIMFAVGEQDSEANSDAKRIFSRLERGRPPLPKDLTPAELMRQKDLVFITAPTSLQGTKLAAPEFNRRVNGPIIFFLKARVLDRRDEFPWKQRGNVIGG